MAPTNDSTDTEKLLEQFSRGDSSALDTLVASQRSYLRRLIDLRMEQELRGRVDSSDVVQETLLVVSRRIDDFVERRPTSFRLWVRRKAVERLIELRRKHLAERRSVRREVTLSDASSMAVARRLLGASPSQAVQQQELAKRSHLVPRQSWRLACVTNRREFVTAGSEASIDVTSIQQAFGRLGFQDAIDRGNMVWAR